MQMGIHIKDGVWIAGQIQVNYHGCGLDVDPHLCSCTGLYLSALSALTCELASGCEIQVGAFQVPPSHSSIQFPALLVPL